MWSIVSDIHLVYAINMTYSDKDIMKKFGGKVKLYRNLAGLTQEQLAEKCECSSQTISGTETGYSFPSSKVLFSMSEALNVPLVYLFNFNEDQEIGNSETASIINKAVKNMNSEQKKFVLKMVQCLTED